MSQIQNHSSVINTNSLLSPLSFKCVDQAVENNNRFPLHDAVKAQDYDLVQKLVSSGNFSIDAENEDNKTPLSLAVGLKDPQLVKMLLKLGADINTTFLDHQTVLHQATYDQNISMCEFLLEQGANLDIMQHWSYFYATGTPLHLAAAKNNSDLVQLFIKHHANPNSRNEWGETPLHIAAYYGANAQVIEALIQAGAHVNKLNGLNSWTASGSPLHVAANRNKINTLEALLKNGASIDLLNEKDQTALMVAIENEKIEATRMLLNYSPNLSIRDENGETALELASKKAQAGSSKSKEILQLLLNVT